MLRKADAHNDGGATLGHIANGLLALCGAGDFELAVFDTGGFHKPFGTIESSLVERFVELAAHVENDGG